MSSLRYFQFLHHWQYWEAQSKKNVDTACCPTTISPTNTNYLEQFFIQTTRKSKTEVKYPD